MDQHVFSCIVLPLQMYAFHSQDRQMPTCPDGWSNAWMGHSYLMNTAYGAQGGGQQLASPGSCLPHFRSHLFIECNAKGLCGFFQEHKNFWLRVIGSSMDDDMFSMIMGEAIKVRNNDDRIGKCVVCLRTQQMTDFFLR
ncbi:unnamed protein product [Protopolystoma xenopodis]|uniref:Collagen IV NC1 domain-containing protein n=1 Tax=Protopolystoma xenopodis TaxID=117903 RepID=A0A448WLC9_9PLAT|nr:unnamed protein product [Protopolystoma xenopodis]